MRVDLDLVSELQLVLNVTTVHKHGAHMRSEPNVEHLVVPCGNNTVTQLITHNQSIIIIIINHAHQ